MVYREAVNLPAGKLGPNFHNVTKAAQDAVAKSGIRNGLVNVYSHHTTCCVITEECAFDASMTGLDTLQQDFVDILERAIPTCRREGMYLHPGPKALAFAEHHGEDARGCHNTDAHLRSALVGRSETIALIDGQLDLGAFGYIFFIDFDQTRPRSRVVQITVLGE